MYFRHIEDESAASPATPASPPELTRRQFLQLTSLAGSGLTLGILLPGCGSQTGGGRVAASLTMPFPRIAPGGRVTVISKQLPAGQGARAGPPACWPAAPPRPWARRPRATPPAASS